jgi:hypothetical protein
MYCAFQLCCCLLQLAANTAQLILTVCSLLQCIFHSLNCHPRHLQPHHLYDHVHEFWPTLRILCPLLAQVPGIELTPKSAAVPDNYAICRQKLKLLYFMYCRLPAAVAATHAVAATAAAAVVAAAAAAAARQFIHLREVQGQIAATTVYAVLLMVRYAHPDQS